jgi:hypothetical protein
MSSEEDPPLSMSEDGLRIELEPDDPALRARYEALIRDEYQRCNPGDSLDALKHRAAFSKEAQGLLRDWMAVAAELTRKSGTVVRPQSGNSPDSLGGEGAASIHAQSKHR